MLFSKKDVQDISLIVAIVMLLASVPSIGGLAVLGPSHPELSINICQPLQMLDRVSNTLFARPAAMAPEFVLDDLGITVVKEAARPVDFKFAPDTPPPKHSA